jgi:ubiquinone/menaquinone biosynthesis C-methylase UbiE
MKPWVRVTLLLGGAILLVLVLNTGVSFLSTLDELKVVEADRDQWQRPADVLRALDPRPGNTIVDLGSGAGYFTLKVAAVVGSQGKVIAVDLRKVSSLFLRVRAFLRNEHNVEIIVGDADDPHLPAGTADSVLICNTYHEFGNPPLMLDRTYQALRPGGRLVVVDREPGATQDHEIAEASVESELRRRGFEILSKDESFIDRPGDEKWWLVVARKEVRDGS